MKRLALFLGGILVLPAFGEVAPVFYDDAIEYADAEYLDDEYEFVVDEDLNTESATAQTPIMIPSVVKKERSLFPVMDRQASKRTAASPDRRCWIPRTSCQTWLRSRRV